MFLEYIRPLWKRLTFTWKVTMRNLFRYQRRFWMTVIGIGGCTALIVTGFGLHDSIFDILDKQFDEISLYDATVGLEDERRSQATERGAGLPGRRPRRGPRYLDCYQSTADASAHGRTAYNAYLFAVDDPDAAAASSSTCATGWTTAAGGAAPTTAWSSPRSCPSCWRWRWGTPSPWSNGDDRVQATVTDIVENYVYHYVYLTDGLLRGPVRPEPPEDNTVLVAYADGIAPGRVATRCPPT